MLRLNVSTTSHNFFRKLCDQCEWFTLKKLTACEALKLNYKDMILMTEELLLNTNVDVDFIIRKLCCRDYCYFQSDYFWKMKLNIDDNEDYCTGFDVEERRTLVIIFHFLSLFSGSHH